MAYSVSNTCVKSICKRTVLVQFIVKDVVTFFGTQCSGRDTYDAAFPLT